MRITIKFCIALVGMFMIYPQCAYAYIDPGMGSMLLQGLAAAFIGVLMFGRRVVNFVKHTFLKKSHDDTEKDENR